MDQGHRKDGFNSLRESLESVNARNEGVLDATVIEFGYDLQPKLGALIFGDPHAQNFLVTVYLNSDGNVHSFVHNMARCLGL